MLGSCQPSIIVRCLLVPYTDRKAFKRHPKGVEKLERIEKSRSLSVALGALIVQDQSEKWQDITLDNPIARDRVDGCLRKLPLYTGVTPRRLVLDPPCAYCLYHRKTSHLERLSFSFFFSFFSLVSWRSKILERSEFHYHGTPEYCRRH